jgi:ubiquinone/menaquinone biosynthesis C-methylase UbiE
MKFTGERLVSGIPRLENMIVEELARLNFVQSRFEDQTILDAGSGMGYGTRFIAENGARWVLGVDISEETLHETGRSHARQTLAFGVMDCTRLALRDESMDGICSIELIEHLTDTDSYLMEMCRILKPEGWYFLSTPNRKVSSRPDGQVTWAFHEREFSLDELRELLEGYFEQVEIWGSYVAAYEQHPIRKVTKSPLSQIKHILPPGLRLWVSSSIRFWIQPHLKFEDVTFAQHDIEDAPTFVALCQKKRIR